MRHSRVLWLGLVALVACDDGELGPRPEGVTRVLLTDAPFPFDQVRRVDVHIVSIDAAAAFDTVAGADWVTIAAPDRAFNLLELQDGETALLGEGELAAGEYVAVRLTLDPRRSGITLVDGSAATVEWGFDGEIAIHTLVEEALDVPATGADIVIDFDVGRSFVSHPLGAGFLFLPWVRAVNQAATGTIRGTVRGSDFPFESLQPVANASVSVFRRPPGYPDVLMLAATGRTDGQGRYGIHFLTAGDHVLSVAPPADFNAGVSFGSTVRVRPGAQATLDLTLPAPSQGGPNGQRLVISGPASVTVGQAIHLQAFVFSQSGDSVVGAPVMWSVGNPAVVRLEPSGATARLTGLKVGATLVIARSDALADTADLAVGEAGAPAATVAVAPAGATLAVGDRTGFTAILRDAVGARPSGRTIAWSMDSGVVTPLNVYHDLPILRVGAQGTTTVRATARGKQGTAVVTVN